MNGLEKKKKRLRKLLPHTKKFNFCSCHQRVYFRRITNKKYAADEESEKELEPNELESDCLPSPPQTVVDATRRLESTPRPNLSTPKADSRLREY